MTNELTDQERAQGFVRPLRTRVLHTTAAPGRPVCGRPSAMSIGQAEDMAKDPASWTSCWCAVCGRRLPVNQFTWQADGSPVGT
jgi:hypothetical protein